MAWNLDVPDAEYYTLQSPELDGLVREVRDLRKLAIDTETSGLDIVHDSVYYFSISWRYHNRKPRRITLPSETLPAFRESFADVDKTWVLANAKFDGHMLENTGVKLCGKWIDVAVQHALLYEEEPHDLKGMIWRKLGWKYTNFADTFGKVSKGRCVCGATAGAHDKKTGFCKTTGCAQFIQITALDVLRRAERENMGKLIDYACNDAFGTWSLHELLEQELADTPILGYYEERWPYIRTMHDYYHQTEVPFTKVLYACERNGLRVNREYLEEISPGILSSLAELRKEINALTGRMMKTAGPGLAQYFCDEQGLRPFKMTSGGKSGVRKPSIDSKFLKWVAENKAKQTVGKVAALLLEHEAIAKQYSTYIQKMPGRLDDDDRVHMKLNQDVARTGRLTSSDPNMQNVTTGEKDRFHLRRAFIPRDGNIIVCGDYSQLEMRILAAASEEQAMIDIFQKNWDIHTGNAAFIFDVPYDDVVAAQAIDKQVKQGKLPASALTKAVLHCLKIRKDIKTIGFGLNYGMKEKAMALRMGCSVEEAREKLELYMQKYPAVQKFFDDSINEAHAHSAAYTFLGRRRSLPSINSDKNFIRFRAERQASNHPIQGTAAEVCKLAMIHIYEDVDLRENYGYEMCLQVHDEIVGECPEECAEVVVERLHEWMEHPFPTDMGVPLLADINTGPSWEQAK